ncbi:MAG: PLDc_N domain-containing protein [Dehalococcoidaceae bacterium]|nr:PLDc_N domain-containing protein [Dehalococcoidaceae bacterium]
MLPFLIPLLIIQLVLLVIALLDLLKRQNMPGNTRLIWLIVIIFVNIFGPVIYLIFGRKDRPDDSY